MIYGIGVDLCQIGRIAQSVSRYGDRFAKRILGLQEWEHYLQRVQEGGNQRGVCYLATRFAAKEAFGKALGTGISAPLTWTSCEVLQDQRGRPLIVLNGPIAAWFTQQNLRAHISLSDEAEYAMAYVVVEQI